MSAKIKQPPPPRFEEKSCLISYQNINLPLVDYSDSDSESESDDAPDYQSQDYQSAFETQEDDEEEETYNITIPLERRSNFQDWQRRHWRVGSFENVEEFYSDCLHNNFCEFHGGHPGINTDVCFCNNILKDLYCEDCEGYKHNNSDWHDVFGSDPCLCA
jgi:hypothetical protein|tara:strand:+ start:522 stop:1001 length:480 start_codon:yes stop_codon:yes gene_type:complete